MTESTGGKAFLRVKKKKGGRPLTLTEDIIVSVCNHLKHGAFIETAAAAAGVPKSTFYSWLKMANERPKSIHARFLDAVEKAQAHAELNDLMYITKARSKDWKASAWRLERRHPTRWAGVRRPTVPGEVAQEDSGFTLAYNLDDDLTIDAEWDDKSK